MHTLIKEHVFYVYEHWRPDTDVCFYVGKGYGDRAQKIGHKRNKQHRKIVSKLLKIGMCVEVRMFKCGLSEIEALAIEVERIAFWRNLDVKLANATNGGEGVAGMKHSEATKEILRQKSLLQKRRKHSKETKRKIGIGNSISLKGRKNPEHSARLKGRKISEETKKKMSIVRLGKKVSEETKRKISEAHKGKKKSETEKLNMSLAHIGNKHSEETRAKMAASQKLRWSKCQQ